MGVDSGKVVKVERNGTWQDAIDALDAARRALEVSNEPIDDDVKSQNVAELSAGHVLLEARQVRIGALLETAGKTLRYLSATFVNVGIGRAASLAWEKIFKQFLGIG